jgi:hypothetical protein
MTQKHQTYLEHITEMCLDLLEFIPLPTEYFFKWRLLLSSYLLRKLSSDPFPSGFPM